MSDAPTAARTSSSTSRNPDELGGIAEATAAEAAKTRETANRMAEREPSEDVGKEVRQLAGMVQQLAEQVERLALAVGNR
ncbi:MAG TPA: hypothetical protein VLA82_11305 [Actinomycetota bacterium]|nr:hypothetical protein [Actinomycetota bacterium]